MPPRHARHRQRSRAARRRVVVGGAAVVVLGVAVVGVVLTRSGHRAAAAPPRHPRSVVSPSRTTTSPAPASDGALCPLTGLPAPGGRVPNRPALAVKVGNDPAARPQSGLAAADIVYEVQAEGGITRYIAIYQCHEAASIGPVRSLRWVDWHVMEQFGHPILAFAGGIAPRVDEVDALPWLFPVNGLASSAFVRISSRVPPENLYTSTAALWALDPSGHAPSPIFSYSDAPPRDGTQVASATVPFSGASDVVWRWSASRHVWLRFYGTTPDLDASGAQLSAVNVVIQLVRALPGPYNESGPDSLGVDSITVGSGTVDVLRDGELVTGRWVRPAYGDVTRLVGPDGRPIDLTPGNTWVELVPQWVTPSFTP
jgi:hypothetical protein